MSGKKDAIGDSSKPRLSLIPKDALWALGSALTHGEEKYGTFNFKKGIKISFLIDAALRHINQFNAGENIDPDSNNHHLGNAMANLAMAIDMFYNKPEMDDRYKDKIIPTANEYFSNPNTYEKEDLDLLSNLEAETRHFDQFMPLVNLCNCKKCKCEKEEA